MVNIDAPALKPAPRRTLLDVANVDTSAPGYALQNPLKYLPHLVDGHNLDVPEPGTDKDFEKRSNASRSTEVFSAYRGLDQALLLGIDAGQTDLKALFIADEPRFLEEKAQELLLNPNAVDITPGGAVTNPKAAIGLLEQWIATRYLFAPTIAGDLLAVDLLQPGVPYVTETAHGAPIGSAAGFTKTGPGGTVAGANEAWLYIFGQINFWTSSTPEVVGGPDLYKNRDHSLAEKSYAASIDGPVAAIRIGF